MSTRTDQSAVMSIVLGDPIGPGEGPVEQLRILEAVLFAAAEPMTEAELAERLPRGADPAPLLAMLRTLYAPRGVNLVRVGGRWAFRTAGDLAFILHKEPAGDRKLSRAALETLAIIAYHQPVTRAEIEDVRGVAVSRGALDVLLETGWVRIRGRRKVPGRPLTFGTTPAFLDHFGLESIGDLPGLEELKSAGLLDGRLPPGFDVPAASDDPGLRDDEEPAEQHELDLTLSGSPTGTAE